MKGMKGDIGEKGLSGMITVSFVVYNELSLGVCMYIYTVVLE